MKWISLGKDTIRKGNGKGKDFIRKGEPKKWELKGLHSERKP